MTDKVWSPAARKWVTLGQRQCQKPTNKTVIENQVKELSMSRQGEPTMPDVRNNYINLSAWWSIVWQGSTHWSETGQNQANVQLLNNMGETGHLLEQEFKLETRAKTIPCGLITLNIKRKHLLC